MKIILLLAFLPFSALASSPFLELRIGLEDNYKKVVQHETNGKLQGNFKGQNLGLRAGYQFEASQVFIEINPEQKVEIKSANELAKVNSTFVGYRYQVLSGFLIGGQLGYSSFELVKGPSGVEFNDNPTTSGLTYGVNLGYQYMFSNQLYVLGEGVYNVGNYKTNGPGSTPVDTIEIQNQSQINLNIGYIF